MTRGYFRLFTHLSPRKYVIPEGRLLARRQERKHHYVTRYHCADERRDFLVEVGGAGKQPVVLRRFVRAGLLKEYIYCVRLPTTW